MKHHLRIISVALLITVATSFALTRAQLNLNGRWG